MDSAENICDNKILQATNVYFRGEGWNSKFLVECPGYTQSKNKNNPSGVLPSSFDWMLQGWRPLGEGLQLSENRDVLVCWIFLVLFS